jgi:ubiquinone/menaquinone biosynthesis C-methylase UbiE
MSFWERGFASVYDRMNGAMEAGVLGRRRAALVGPLRGRIIEIGAGTGANLAHYQHAERVICTEPSAPMRERLEPRIAAAAVPIEVRDAAAESLPFDDAEFDVAVSTLVLCTVGDVSATLAEVRRVLKPGGQLVFIEHGGGAGGRRGAWQRRLDPIWTKVGCGCHLTRDVKANLEHAGFDIIEFEQFSPKRIPPVLLPFAQGVAVP